MPLARIITHSQACSRELAMALSARGYAVEIVSPDKVPDNIADLELRVDTGPGNQLVANVEAHDGERTASLEFVHYLKAPVVDIQRRPPEAAHIGREPVALAAEPGVKGTEVPVVVSQLARTAIAPKHETLPSREADPGERARLITLPQVLLAPPENLARHFASEDAAPPRSAAAQLAIVPPVQAVPRRNRFGAVPLRAALAFGGMALLAAVLGISMDRSSEATAQSSEALSVEGVATATGVNLLNVLGAEKDLAGSGQIAAVRWPPAAVDSKGNSARALAAKSETATESLRTAVSHRHGDDFIARDTTIYFDKRFEPTRKHKPTKPIARRESDRGQSR